MRTQAQAEKRATPLYSTAACVTGLSVAERALGFLYRIVLSRLIGAEGLGIYQVALSVFSVFLTLGTGGIPITVSRLITKSKAENDSQGTGSATAAGVTLSLLLTLPFLLLFLLSNNTFAFLFSDARCLPVFRILLLGLCCSSLYAVIRGSFWGQKQFLLPSILELAEESVMVIAGVLLLQNVQSPLSGAIGAAWAVVISYLFSFTTSTLSFFIYGGKLSSPKKSMKPLFNATMPITFVRTSGTFIASAVSVLLPAMLIRAGASQSEAFALFGVASGMALPILMIPSTVIGSLSLVLIPEVSEDFYRKNYQNVYRNIARGILVAVLLSCFLLPFFYALGEDLGLLAFSNALAGELIRKGCIVLLPMSVSMITTSILNSLGFEKQTFVFYFIGSAVLLACIFFLPALCGVYAYIIGMGANFFINSLCNLLLLYKKCKGFYAHHGKALLTLLLRAVCAVLPLSLLGKLLNVWLRRYFGALLTMFVSAFLLTVATLLLWLLLKIISKNLIKTSILSVFAKRKQKMLQKNTKI